MNLAFLSQFIDANKLGGWVRAGVASWCGYLIAHYAAKYPILTDVLSPEVQAAIGVVFSGAAVGLWSQLTKTDTAVIPMLKISPGSKLTMAAEIPGPAKEAAFAGIPDAAKIAAVTALPDVEKIVVQPKASDGVGAALADPTQTKVVSQ